MNLIKVFTITVTLLWITSCGAQKRTEVPITGGNSDYSFHIVFLKNSIQLDSISKGKEMLDYLGRAIRNGIDLNKYSILLGVSSNEKEINRNKYLDSNRIVFILNYLKENYDIDSENFVIHFFSKNNEPSYILYSLIEKFN